MYRRILTGEYTFNYNRGKPHSPSTNTILYYRETDLKDREQSLR